MFRSISSSVKFLKPFLAYVMSKSNHSDLLVGMLLDVSSTIVQANATQNAIEILYLLAEMLATQVKYFVFFYSDFTLFSVFLVV